MIVAEVKEGLAELNRAASDRDPRDLRLVRLSEGVSRGLERNGREVRKARNEGRKRDPGMRC